MKGNQIWFYFVLPFPVLVYEGFSFLGMYGEFDNISPGYECPELAARSRLSPAALYQAYNLYSSGYQPIEQKLYTAVYLLPFLIIMFCVTLV